MMKIMKNYFLTREERADLKDRIEKAVNSSSEERKVIRAVEIAVNGMYSSKLECYVVMHQPSEVRRLIMIDGICNESSTSEIKGFADRVVEMVGQTNDPDFWVSEEG